MTTRQQAGYAAKIDGHDKESNLANILTESTQRKHKTDGSSKTKVDVYSVDGSDKYSQKSPSGKNTQVHLTPTHVWLKYFSIDGSLADWFWQFFGLAGSMRAGRKNISQIDSDLNEQALCWFNQNKKAVFDVIVRHGAFLQDDGSVKAGDSVNKVVWFNKKTDTIVHTVTVDDLADRIEDGQWVWAQKKNGETKSNATVLWFLDSAGNKMFHLQMKGSGKPSQFNNLQFHIYKPEV
tara:strand:+ start:470 stop:1177 length:708 start_codon:yes stop_codon:yes gene_type:complete